MAIESSFIPFPSEIVIPPAAYQAAATGEMQPWLIVFFGTLGADIGATVNYFLALWLGRPVVYAFARSRFGHLCLLDEDKVAYAEQYFDRHGALSTFVGRLVPAVRQLISIPAGLARMSFMRFILYTTMGAAVWNSILAAIGWSLQSVVPPQQLNEHVMRYSTELKYAAIVLGVAVITYLVYKARK